MATETKKMIKRTTHIKKQSPVQPMKKTIQKEAEVQKPIAEKTRSSPSRKSGEKILPILLPYHPQKGEGYMSARMKTHFRQVLLDWRNTLTQEMAETVNSIKETPTQFADLSDRATQEEQFNLELRERDRDRKLIKKIDDTIKRIDEDTYGYCDACGEEIGLRRLEARPTAVLCVDCKTLDEIREKQEGI